MDTTTLNGQITEWIVQTVFWGFVLFATIFVCHEQMNRVKILKEEY